MRLMTGCRTWPAIPSLRLLKSVVATSSRYLLYALTLGRFVTRKHFRAHSLIELTCKTKGHIMMLISWLKVILGSFYMVLVECVLLYVALEILRLAGFTSIKMSYLSCITFALDPLIVPGDS